MDYTNFSNFSNFPNSPFQIFTVTPEYDMESVSSLEEAEDRVARYCRIMGKDEYFVELALALTVYDHHEAPSNWSKLRDQEKTIYDWCAFVIEEDHEDIGYVLRAYRKGLIPDCFSMMMDFFT